MSPCNSPTRSKGKPRFHPACKPAGPASAVRDWTRRRGRSGGTVAADLEISEQTIYLSRRQHLIDTGQLPGTTSSENADLVATRQHIAELEAEIAIIAELRTSCIHRTYNSTCARSARSAG
jgi:hypothetical protein